MKWRPPEHVGANAALDILAGEEVAAEPSQWLDALLRQVQEFTRERGGRAPVVRVTLADGEQFFLFAIEAGPGNEFSRCIPQPRALRRATEGLWRPAQHSKRASSAWKTVFQ